MLPGPNVVLRIKLGLAIFKTSTFTTVLACAPVIITLNGPTYLLFLFMDKKVFFILFYWDQSNVNSIMIINIYVG